MKAEQPGARGELLAERLGHAFADPTLLALALIHPSHRNERPEVAADNQRLEFLGDAALALFVGEFLYRALPSCDEGELTMLRSRVVCAAALARVGRRLGVGAALRLGRGERQSGGSERDSVLADAVEALVGAVYLDAGPLQANRLVLQWFEAETTAVLAMAAAAGPKRGLLRLGHGWKAELQQRAQAGGGELPVYRLVEATGPAHARRFEVEVQATIDGAALRSSGDGATKKAAEAAAARGLLEGLGGAADAAESARAIAPEAAAAVIADAPLDPV